MRRLFSVLALAVVTCAASEPLYAARTDVVVLRNGDRLTGEVVELRQGKLKVKTDDMGTLSIEWDKVAAVTTAEWYDVTMRDGSLLYGRLRPGAAGTMEIVGDTPSATAVTMAEVASMAAIKSKFLDRITGSFDLGGSYTQSSGVAQFSLDTQARYRRPGYNIGASFSSNLTRQPDAEDTSRWSSRVTYTRYRGRQWFVSALGLFEGNEDLGFTFRGTGALSIGRYLVRSNRMELLVNSGFAGGREFPLDGANVTNVDLMVGSDLSVFAYDYPTTSLDIAVLAFPSLDDPGRVRLNVSGKYKQELFRDFYLSVSGYDAFDNRPKSASADRNDVGASLSFGWSF
ncbi:MAG TPA: DUF481 domain-containing protein [Vicinamibacterales bacterium]